MSWHLDIEPALYLIEQLNTDNRLMLTVMHLTLVGSLAVINPVARQVKQNSTAKRFATDGATSGGDALL